MSTSNENNYLSIGEEVQKGLGDEECSTFRIDLYGELLEEGPVEVIFIGLRLGIETENYVEPIRKVIKNQFSQALAFKCERIHEIDKPYNNNSKLTLESDNLRAD